MSIASEGPMFLVLGVTVIICGWRLWVTSLILSEEYGVYGYISWLICVFIPLYLNLVLGDYVWTNTFGS